MIDLVSAPPAQLTRMSSLPNSATVVSTNWRHASAVVTSVGTAKRAPAHRYHFLGRRFQRVGAAAGQHDVGAVFGQARGRRRGRCRYRHR